MMFDAERVKEACVAWIREFFRENGPECNDRIDQLHAANRFKLLPMPAFDPGLSLGIPDSAVMADDTA